jgi:hypothetical protein
MDRFPKINRYVQSALKRYLDSWMVDLPEVSKDFCIQHSVFIRPDDYDFEKFAGEPCDCDNGDVCDRHPDWFLACTVSKANRNSIYDIDVEYSNEMSVDFISDDDKYEMFIFDGDLGKYNEYDYMGESWHYKFYASDLYDDFKSKNYSGVCVTKGFSLVGWYEFDINDYLPFEDNLPISK